MQRPTFERRSGRDVQGARVPALALLAVSTLALAGCSESRSVGPGGPDGQVPFAGCTIDTDFILVSLARDAIPSLDDPAWVRADDQVPDYIEPETRVIGLITGGQVWAIPHNVLWYHEILNLDLGGPGGQKLAVTYCPLTGSSLVFDRSSVGGATLGVSGLLFMNNLVFYDRREPNESLWPQMLGTAGCGPGTGTEIAQFPFVEMEWEDWVSLHPMTNVLAGAAEQGFDPEAFDYTWEGYPYGAYRAVDAPFSDAIPPIDRRRFAKERVVGVPSSPEDPGIAFPFGALSELDGVVQVVDFEYEGEAAVVLWSDAAQGGSAYFPVTDGGNAVTLSVVDSRIEDEETGSSWSVDGRATSGPLAGERLVAVSRAYTAFWLAWAAFHPDTRLWEG